MKILVTILILLSPLFSLSDITEGKSGEYIKSRHHYISNLDRLNNTSIVGLNKKEMELRATAISLYKNREDNSLTLKYLNIFPSNLVEFLDVFENKRNSDIKDFSYIYIDLLHQSAMEHPTKGAEVLLSISKSACLKADLMNYLQNALIEFTVHNTDQYLTVNDKLTKQEKETLANFFVAKLYSDDPGLCKD